MGVIPVPGTGRQAKGGPAAVTTTITTIIIIITTRGMGGRSPHLVCDVQLQALAGEGAALTPGHLARSFPGGFITAPFCLGFLSLGEPH